MKVAYLGKIQLSDTDLPFLHEAQQMADVTYFIEITPRFLQGPAFNIQHIYNKSGLFKAQISIRSSTNWMGSSTSTSVMC